MNLCSVMLSKCVFAGRFLSDWHLLLKQDHCPWQSTQSVDCSSLSAKPQSVGRTTTVVLVLGSGHPQPYSRWSTVGQVHPLCGIVPPSTVFKGLPHCCPVDRGYHLIHSHAGFWTSTRKGVQRLHYTGSGCISVVDIHPERGPRAALRRKWMQRVADFHPERGQTAALRRKWMLRVVDFHLERGPMAALHRKWMQKGSFKPPSESYWIATP